MEGTRKTYEDIVMMDRHPTGPRARVITIELTFSYVSFFLAKNEEENQGGKQGKTGKPGKSGQNIIRY